MDDIVEPKIVEFNANILKCNVAKRIQLPVQVVRAENDSPCLAVIIFELAGGKLSGKVGILKYPGVLRAPTPVLL